MTETLRFTPAQTVHAEAHADPIYVSSVDNGFTFTCDTPDTLTVTYSPASLRWHLPVAAIMEASIDASGAWTGHTWIIPAGDDTGAAELALAVHHLVNPPDNTRLIHVSTMLGWAAYSRALAEAIRDWEDQHST